MRWRAEGGDQVEASARKIAASTEKAQQASMSLAGGLSKAAAGGLLLAGTLGGVSENPLLQGFARVAQGAAIGANYGGPWGAAIGGGLEAITALIQATRSEPKVEINTTLQAVVQDGAIQRAADEARRKYVEALEQRLFEVESKLAERTRFGREMAVLRLPR